MDPKLLREINRKLDRLLSIVDRPVWVGPKEYRKATGITAQQLRYRRDAGLIETRKSKTNGIEYRLP